MTFCSSGPHWGEANASRLSRATRAATSGPTPTRRPSRATPAGWGTPPESAKGARRADAPRWAGIQDARCIVETATYIPFAFRCVRQASLSLSISLSLSSWSRSSCPNLFHPIAVTQRLPELPPPPNVVPHILPESLSLSIVCPASSVKTKMLRPFLVAHLILPYYGMARSGVREDEDVVPLPRGAPCTSLLWNGVQ